MYVRDQVQPQQHAQKARKAQGEQQAKRDTYQVITDAVLDALEMCGPFERPWAAPTLSMPVNVTTGRPYRGSNVVMLWVTAQEAGYRTNQWATFKQWAEKGANVRKGEKGTPVIWFQMLDRKAETTNDDPAQNEATGKIPCARLSWVFNAAQVEGYDEPDAVPVHDPVSGIASADALMKACGATISHEGLRAYYRPSSDAVVLPPREAFHGTSTMTATEV